MMFLMSQDRPPSRNGSSKIVSMNHVLMHSPQMQYTNSSSNNNNNNIVINQNGFLAMEAAAANNPHIILSKASSTMPSITTPIVSSMNYITAPTNVATNGDAQNGVNGNHHNHHHQILLLANEKLELSDNDEKQQNLNEERKTSNDEELTSLTWLHDKNLLKGINLSCPKVQSPNENGRLSIISKSNSADEKEDSGVSSVDNISLNSSVEQNEIYSTPASPKPLNFTKIMDVHNNSKNIPTSMFSTQTIENAIKVLDRNSSLHVTEVVKVVSSRDYLSSSNLNSEESINQIIKAPQTPHQHFHKRYLREQFKQQDEDKKHDQQQSTQLSSYIIAKPQQQQLADGRFIIGDEHVLANYHNNNNNNYESSGEYDLSTKAIDYAMPKVNSLNTSCSSTTSSLSSSPSPKSSQKPHPSNVPYDPLVHTTSKPPYSFSSLIFMAIEDSMQKALPVKEIYAWIIQHFPYFKTAPTGWKNSVRHNLSLNKCFQKVEKAANLGKGSLWMVEPQYRPNLIQALTRSPFHPCSTWEKHMKNLAKTPSESPKSNGSSTRLLNPEHFPFLSRRLAAAMENFEEDQSRSSTPSTNYEMPQNYSLYHNNNNSIVINGNISNSEIFTRELNAETIDDVNAATAMLALKHGPKIFTEGIPIQPPIVTTTSPSEDHTYSIFNGGKNGTDNNSNGTSSDAAYESSDENNIVYHFTQPLNEQELEEQRKQAEGVDALLNLAGYNTNTTTLLLKRPINEDQPPPPQQQQHFIDKKQYFYTTEVVNASTNNTHFMYDDEPPAKKSKSRLMKNKLKKKPWSR